MSTVVTPTTEGQGRAYAPLVVAFAALWVTDAVTTLTAFALGWKEGNAGFLALIGGVGLDAAFVIKFLAGFVPIGVSLLARRVLPRVTCYTLALICGGMLGIDLWNVTHILASLLTALRHLAP